MDTDTAINDAAGHNSILIKVRQLQHVHFQQLCGGGGLTLTKYRTTSGPFLWSWDQSDSGDDECYKYHHYSHSISVISSYSYMLCSYEVRERIRLYFRADPSRTDFFCNQILLQPDSSATRFEDHFAANLGKTKKWQQSHATKSSKPAIGRHVETTGRDKHSINRRTNSKSCNNHSPSETLELMWSGSSFERLKMYFLFYILAYKDIRILFLCNLDIIFTSLSHSSTSSYWLSIEIC